jgi:hypothetical protein
MVAAASAISQTEPMELGCVIQALYDSEINCSITTFWDGGFTVRLGDEMNGFVAEQTCATASESAIFLCAGGAATLP